MEPRLCSSPTTTMLILKVAVYLVRMYIPAQVCKLLIDSLQRHREVVVCGEGVRSVVSSLGSSRGRSKQNEVLWRIEVSD